jgi:beta-lactamase superfamily II metal-dependent hydrolase
VQNTNEGRKACNMKIKFLKAFNGDSIHISFKDEEGARRNILIDGGVGETYITKKGKKGKPEFGELKKVVEEIKDSGQLIDLMIITHIDEDHIDGILKWFDEDKNAYKLISEVWFNSGSLIAEHLKSEENKDLQHFINPNKTTLTSVNQGIEFSQYINDKGIWERKIILQGNTITRFGVEFKFLSPDREKLKALLVEWKKKDPCLKTGAKEPDYSISLKEHIEKDKFEQDTACPNGSSIAFILTFKGKSFLLLGDSHPSVIVDGLKIFEYSDEKRLNAELVKISHHGSKGNTSCELLSMIDSKSYIISTNGKSHQHPHKQFLARLINEKENCNIYFNYEERMKMIFSEDDRKVLYPMIL